MDQTRPKSGHLKTGPAQQRRHSSKYEQRRYTNDISKSINILPIKIQNQNVGAHERLVNNNETMKTINMSQTKVSAFGNKENGASNNKRRTLLSIKSKPSLRFQDMDEFRLMMSHPDGIITTTDTHLTKPISTLKNKRPSIQLATHPSSPIEQDTDKLFQLLHRKKQIMMLDQTRLIIEATKFKSLLNDFQTKFQQVKTDRDSLSQKVEKYECYFKEMRLKNLPVEGEEDTLEKNHQLKILNLEKKVETLNYIIKQYRQGNGEEIKGFEQRLKVFKPNIEKELTQKLAQTNEKYSNLLKKVQFFQQQCRTNTSLDWHQLMTQFQQTKHSNTHNLAYITDLTTQLQHLTHILTQNSQKLRLLDHLQQQNLSQKAKIDHLNDRKLQLQEQIQQKDKKLDELNHMYEETSFKLEGLQNLKVRIENKDRTIKKNTVLINRLQCENIELKSKVETVLSEFQSRMFCEKRLQENLSKANTTIHELTTRLHQTFLDFCQHPTPQATKEKQHFIGHLFQKVKCSYNQIITEYQNQLKLTNTQCQTWKHTFSLMSKNREQRVEFLEKVKVELERIHEKKMRCQEGFNRVSCEALEGRECGECKHLVAYWGQLENSYGQLRKVVEGVVRVGVVDGEEAKGKQSVQEGSGVGNQFSSFIEGRSHQQQYNNGNTTSVSWV